jgi:hypothetical protein
LVAFLTDAGDNRGFSWFGAHCLENFFGLIRRNAFHDDRPETTEKIIVKTPIIADILHMYDIVVIHRNRSKLGNVTIDPGELDYERAESMANVLLKYAKHITDLNIFSSTDATKEVLVQETAIMQESLER